MPVALVLQGNNTGGGVSCGFRDIGEKCWGLCVPMAIEGCVHVHLPELKR